MVDKTQIPYLNLLWNLAHARSDAEFRVFSDILGHTPAPLFPAPLRALTAYLFEAEGKPIQGKLYSEFADIMQTVDTAGENRELGTDDLQEVAATVVGAINRDVANRVMPYLLDQMNTGTITPQEFWETSAKYRDMMDNIGTGGTMRDPEELEKSTYELLMALARGETEKLYINTFIDDLKLEAGLHVLAALPGVGKSSLADYIALTCARRKYNVAIASLEMQGEKVYRRWVQAMSGYRIEELVGKGEDHPAWRQIASRLALFKELPLRILDAPSQTLADIAQFTRRVVSRLGHINLLVVDYSDMIFTGSTDQISKLDEIGRSLVGLQRKVNRQQDEAFAIMLIMAMNKAVTQRGDGTPHLSDLKWDGGYHAETVHMLWLPQAYASHPDFLARYGAMEMTDDAVFLNKVKDRNGPVFGVYHKLRHLSTTKWQYIP